MRTPIKTIPLDSIKWVKKFAYFPQEIDGYSIWWESYYQQFYYGLNIGWDAEGQGWQYSKRQVDPPGVPINTIILENDC